jgi:8-oxo-dGTP pyrophosphatase MutT (NUDIX family)
VKRTLPHLPPKETALAKRVEQYKSYVEVAGSRPTVVVLLIDTKGRLLIVRSVKPTYTARQRLLLGALRLIGIDRGEDSPLQGGQDVGEEPWITAKREVCEEVTADPDDIVPMFWLCEEAQDTQRLRDGTTVKKFICWVCFYYGDPDTLKPNPVFAEVSKIWWLSLRRAYNRIGISTMRKHKRVWLQDVVMPYLSAKMHEFSRGL